MRTLTLLHLPCRRQRAGYQASAPRRRRRYIHAARRTTLATDASLLNRHFGSRQRAQSPADDGCDGLWQSGWHRRHPGLMQTEPRSAHSEIGMPDSRYATTGSNQKCSVSPAAPVRGPSPDGVSISSRVRAVSRSFSRADSPRNYSHLVAPRAPNAAGQQFVGSRTFALEYDLEEVGRWGVSKVELWGTRDGGQTWYRFAHDDDHRSPLVVTVDEEGLYGFRIVVESRLAAVGDAAEPGDAPELWVSVDLHRPIAELTAIEQGAGNLSDHLILRWRADGQ